MGTNDLLKAQTWAVVGATENPNKYGNKVVKKLIRDGHKVIPINPRYTVIEDLKVYRSLSEVDEKIDVVMLIVNPNVGILAVQECIELGINKIWVQPGADSEEITKTAINNHIEIVHSCILTY